MTRGEKKLKEKSRQNGGSQISFAIAIALSIKHPHRDPKQVTSLLVCARCWQPGRHQIQSQNFGLSVAARPMSSRSGCKVKPGITTEATPRVSVPSHDSK